VDAADLLGDQVTLGELACCPVEWFDAAQVQQVQVTVADGVIVVGDGCQVKGGGQVSVESLLCAARVCLKGKASAVPEGNRFLDMHVVGFRAYDETVQRKDESALLLPAFRSLLVPKMTFGSLLSLPAENFDPGLDIPAVRVCLGEGSGWVFTDLADAPSLEEVSRRLEARGHLWPPGSMGSLLASLGLREDVVWLQSPAVDDELGGILPTEYSVMDSGGFWGHCPRTVLVTPHCFKVGAWPRFGDLFDLPVEWFLAQPDLVRYRASPVEEGLWHLVGPGDPGPGFMLADLCRYLQDAGWVWKVGSAGRLLGSCGEALAAVPGFSADHRVGGWFSRFSKQSGSPPGSFGRVGSPTDLGHWLQAESGAPALVPESSLEAVGSVGVPLSYERGRLRHEFCVLGDAFLFAVVAKAYANMDFSVTRLRRVKAIVVADMKYLPSGGVWAPVGAVAGAKVKYDVFSAYVGCLFYHFGYRCARRFLVALGLFDSFAMSGSLDVVDTSDEEDLYYGGLPMRQEEVAQLKTWLGATSGVQGIRMSVTDLLVITSPRHSLSVEGSVRYTALSTMGSALLDVGYALAGVGVGCDECDVRVGKGSVVASLRYAPEGTFWRGPHVSAGDVNLSLDTVCAFVGCVYASFGYEGAVSFSRALGFPSA